MVKVKSDKLKLMYATALALEATKYKSPELLENKLDFFEDLKPRNKQDLTARVEEDTRSAHENPVRYLVDAEYWRPLTAFVEGLHNDLSMAEREVLGLVRTAYNALFNIFRETVLKMNEYKPNAKDGFALHGSG
ncbi:MAG TPA: hypothetical protein VJK72_04030 [Candidatus Nanoarchaeia archaeon]|nr:hypothetical protein [Candidatus Nanoarchaeia archaeon]